MHLKGLLFVIPCNEDYILAMENPISIILILINPPLTTCNLEYAARVYNSYVFIMVYALSGPNPLGFFFRNWCVNYNCTGTVLAYGQTSSGKTYTMQGSASDPGVIRLAIQDVFINIDRVSHLFFF